MTIATPSEANAFEAQVAQFTPPATITGLAPVATTGSYDDLTASV